MNGWFSRTLWLTGLRVLIDGAWLLAGCTKPAEPTAPRAFTVRGTVREVQADERQVIVSHEEIPGYMAAMTMPFRVKSSHDLAGLAGGDRIRFTLHVTADESWIDGIKKLAATTGPAPGAPAAGSAAAPTPAAPRRLAEVIAGVTFTNELGQTVRWSQFDGQAIGFTFFFTRCPLPEYCPRLAKNFAGASRKLSAMSEAPTNWHLLSLTFDPEFDQPAVLRAYAQAYGADTNRWSFLVTSPEDTVRLAQLFGLNYVREAGTFNHDFRTVILDAPGRLQMIWPVGGDTTDMLVKELLKAARATAEETPPAR